MWYCNVCKDLHNDKDICSAGASRPMSKGDLRREIIDEMQKFYDTELPYLVETSSEWSRYSAPLKDWIKRLTDIEEGRLPFKTMADYQAEKMGLDRHPTLQESMEWKRKRDNPDG